MEKFFTVLTLTLVLVSSINSYVIAEKINRETVESETFKNNPLISIAKLKLDSAKKEYRMALGKFLPKVELHLGASQNFGMNFRHRGNHLFSGNLLCGLNISFSAFEVFDKYAEEKALGVKVAQASYDRVVADVMYNSTAGYINLIYDYEMKELLNRVKKRMIENRNIVRLKYNSGIVDISALRMAEFDIVEIEQSLKVLERDIAVNSALLLKSMGRSDDTAVLETDEHFDIYCRELPREPDYSNMITAIPEFLIAQYKVGVSKAQSTRAKIRSLPSLDLSSGGEYAYTDQFRSYISATARYMLFAGGQISGDIKIASNGIEIASEELKVTFDYLKGEARKHYSNLISAYEMIDVKKQYLDTLKLRAEISSENYVKGFLDHEAWYNIEKRYISSQESLLEAKRNAALKTAEWRKFICDK